jgi:hypothetical protein
MSNLFEQLLGLSEKHQDKWECAQKVLDLEAFIRVLTEELEQFRSSTQAEIDKLRMQVEVLQVHETKRKRG